MRPLATARPRDLDEAVRMLEAARRDGRRAVVAGGGSDLLGMVKDRLVEPDLVVSLAGVRGLDGVVSGPDGLRIGGLITLDALSRHAALRGAYAALAQAAESVGTPQIRNVATLAGNVCQRPWCWYYRGGFPCFKNGGTTCFAVTGESQLHAIFGGGPSYIVHPSDTAPALVALDASFRLVGPSGERVVPAREFFTLPAKEPARENVLAADEVLAEVRLPARSAAHGAYHKVLDREAWTHAVVSAAVVADLEGGICRRARVVLGGVAPVPWPLPAVERMLEGQRLTPDLAARAAGTAVAGATPLAKNAYKVPLTRAVVRRALLALPGAEA
jgi:xanthine dehydrogenase YagS FAD-binding subunit